MEVAEGGSVYTPGVGSDSYTNWNWTLYENGEESDYLWLETDHVAEMINMGAKLVIEAPEDFLDDDCEQDEEDE